MQSRRETALCRFLLAALLSIPAVAVAGCMSGPLGLGPFPIVRTLVLDPCSLRNVAVGQSWEVRATVTEPSGATPPAAAAISVVTPELVKVEPVFDRAGVFKVTALDWGQATVNAAYEGLTCSCTLDVVHLAVVQYGPDPAETQAFVIRGVSATDVSTLRLGEVVDLNAAIEWERAGQGYSFPVVSDMLADRPDVLQLVHSNPQNAYYRATGLAPGTATVTAAYENRKAVKTITILP